MVAGPSSGPCWAAGWPRGRRKKAEKRRKNERGGPAAPFAFERENGRCGSQPTISLRFLRARMRTFFEAGFALMVIFSPVNGLTPSRALVAAFFTTRILHSPGSVNTPLDLSDFLIWSPSDSSTPLTCFLLRSVLAATAATICDFVGAAFFFAIELSPVVLSATGRSRQMNSGAHHTTENPAA